MNDKELLLMALAGYKIQRANLDAAIERIESKIGHPESLRKRRKFTAAALENIRRGQRKRWKEFRQRHYKEASRG